MHSVRSTLSSLAGTAALAWALLLMPAPATAQTAACISPSDVGRLDYPLRRVAQRLAAHQPLTIVAVGSSSTAGAGATSSAATYPSRLEIELKERFPKLPIRVLNRGVGGEEMADMLARFDKAVVAEQPDLVLWQLGTNSVLRDHDVTGAEALIHQGVARIRAAGADVILIDPQFAPRVIAKADAEKMVDLISATAKMDNVSVFHRFVVMRYWSKVKHIPFDTFVSPDGLHMNDWSYACVAKLLAGAIQDAATRATTMAGAPHAAVTSTAP